MTSSKPFSSTDKILEGYLDLFHLAKSFFDVSLRASQSLCIETKYFSDMFDVLKQKLKEGMPKSEGKNLNFERLEALHHIVEDVILSSTAKLQSLSPQDKKQFYFVTDFMLSLFHPSNVPFLNPSVIREIRKTRGKNLEIGFKTWLEDQSRWRGYIQMTRTPLEKFELGVHIAATPGKVVYQNEIMQLIAYNITTAEIFSDPLLLVTSWINKYYILDLKPKNSFVQWAVSQGHPTFVISWINPESHQKDFNFSDYLLNGVVAAIEKILQITRTKAVNLFGFCLGGTLAATATAYLAGKKQQEKIRSLSLIASLLDFSDPGAFAALTQEKQIRFFEHCMHKTGIWDGFKMASAFNLILPRENIWPFWIRRYLLGKGLPTHELLYWASDMTNTSEALYRFYMRALIQNNVLIKKDGLKILDVAIDFSKVQVPIFCVGFREDHVSPWTGCLRSRLFFASETYFVLANGGHLNGIISKPGILKNDQSLFTKTTPRNIRTPEVWIAQCQRDEKTWQTHWLDWVAGFSRKTGSGSLLVEKKFFLEEAPGHYAKKILWEP